jgi:DNA-binding NarL/FixJ family response regulator
MSDVPSAPSADRGTESSGRAPDGTTMTGTVRPSVHAGGAQPVGSERAAAQGIRIFVIDDSRLYREAIADLLRDEPWVGAVETAADGATATLHDVAFPPTVTLLNMATEESLDWLRALSEARARVVVLGVRETEPEPVSCAECGAAGYLLRSDSLGSLCSVVQAVARSESICSPKTTAVLLRRVATLAAERRSRNGLDLLTAREAEILDLIEHGLANRDISKELHIEVRTVKNHVHAILGVERRDQAAARARAGRTPLARI